MVNSHFYIVFINDSYDQLKFHIFAWLSLNPNYAPALRFEDSIDPKKVQFIQYSTVQIIQFSHFYEAETSEESHNGLPLLGMFEISGNLLNGGSKLLFVLNRCMHPPTRVFHLIDSENFPTTFTFHLYKCKIFPTDVYFVHSLIP